jgi:hypothetical protein
MGVGGVGVWEEEGKQGRGGAQANAARQCVLGVVLTLALRHLTFIDLLWSYRPTAATCGRGRMAGGGGGRGGEGRRPMRHVNVLCVLWALELRRTTCMDLLRSYRPLRQSGGEGGCVVSLASSKGCDRHSTEWADQLRGRGIALFHD